MNQIHRIKDFLTRHEKVLWWLHSAWALSFGIGFMWLGAKNFTYLRVAIFHLAFIWLASLFLPVLLKHPKLSPEWANRTRLAVNYFSKNFFQQVAFFVLPLYHQSATYFSRNSLFMLLLVVSAVLSTLDTVYDDHISRKWHLIGLFLAFNIFASFNVMFPVLFRISNTTALILSGGMAAAVFATLSYRHSGLAIRGRLLLSVAGALVLSLVVLLGRSFVPPAPLRLANGEFGTSIERGDLKIREPLKQFPAEPGQRLYFLSAVKAPMGLEETIRHVWYLDGDKVHESRSGSILGGRREGFRFWSSPGALKGGQGKKLTVDVVTQGGQLIGRSRLD